jgi:hypothetical protein
MVMADAGGDDYKLTLAQQIFGRTAAILGRHPPESGTNDVSEAKATSKAISAVERHLPVSESSPPTAPHLEAGEGEAQQKQLKTAAELAEMIEQDLAQHPDCPKAGFRVTVYGGSHWRAMLTITPAAGGIRNPGEWRDLTDEFVERLRKRYDLAWEE